MPATELRNDEWDRKAFRLTAFAELDFKDHEERLGKWTRFLGRHRFTGLYNDQSLDTFIERLADSWVSDTENVASIANDVNLTGVRRRLNVAVYVSDPLFNARSIDDVRLSGINIKRPQPGETFEILYADVGQTTAAARRVQSGPMRIERVLLNQTVGRENIESYAFAWQSYLLDEHLVGLFGWRQDESISFDRATQGESGIADTLADGTWNPAATLLSGIPALSEKDTTTTWSLVGRFPERLLFDLPYQTDLQVHYGESANFNPIGLRNDTFGRPLAQPRGETKEYGFTVSVLDNKIVAKVNWFETALLGAGAGAAGNPAMFAVDTINRYLLAERDGFAFSTNRVLLANPGDSPITTYQQFYDAMIGALPGNLAEIVNPRFVDLNGDGARDVLQYDPITNLSATTNASAKGYEIELVANPTDNWRVLVNFSKQETRKTDTAVINAAAVEGFLQGMNQAGVSPLLLDPGTSGGGTPRTIESQWAQGPVARLRALRAEDGVVTNEQRPWRLAAVTNYAFSNDRLKGFGIGGAVRLEAKATTGYPTRLQDGLPVPIVDQPFTDDGLFAGDVWCSYRRKLFDKYDWTIQLNVRNAFGDNDDIPVRTNPDGQVAVIRIPNPTVWSLTNTFRF